MINQSSSSATILVVDDEQSLVDAISYSLRKEGWRVESAGDGVEALAKTRELQPDLVILDVMLPAFDGLQVCRSIRSFSDVPVIFLSAKSEDFDRILGLEIGGDDYLVKPFVMRELVARVRANLRRTSTGIAVSHRDDSRGAAGVAELGSHRVREREVDSRILRNGAVELDIEGRIVLVDGNLVTLKPREFDLLAYLMMRPGKAVSRETLLREVWNYAVSVDTRTVDVHVRALRRAIERDPSAPAMLETVRGHGYRIRDPNLADPSP